MNQNFTARSCRFLAARRSHEDAIAANEQNATHRLICAQVEMQTKKPMFPGDCEIDELFKIFRVLGTPNESVWAGVASLRDYQSIFPSWPRLELSKFAAGLEDSGLDLLDKCLKYAPNQRISAKQALDHAYFDDLDKDVI